MNIYDLEKIRLNLFVTSDVDEKNFEYFLKYNKITKEEYSSLLNDYRQFFKRYKVLNEELSFKEPISIYTLFVYMYKNGFLSKDKSIEFKVFYKKYLDIINLYGTNIFSGKGVCRHIGSMLTDILRESDIRFPNNYGSSISIMGALVMGDAAVSAGIVSPIMIIVVAVTYITSMVFTDVELINSFRHVRFLTLFLVSLLGLFGFYMGVFFTLIHLCSLTSLDRPYTYPLAPFDKVYFNKTVFRSTKKDDKFRSKILTKKNIRKEGD